MKSNLVDLVKRKWALFLAHKNERVDLEQLIIGGTVSH